MLSPKQKSARARWEKERKSKMLCDRIDRQVARIEALRAGKYKAYLEAKADRTRIELQRIDH